MEVDAHEHRFPWQAQGPGRACRAGAAAEIDDRVGGRVIQVHFLDDEVRRQEMPRREVTGKGGALAGRVDWRPLGQKVSALDVADRQRPHGFQKRRPVHRRQVPIGDGFQPRLDPRRHGAGEGGAALAVARVA
jgi:hypothetical protein